MLCRVMEKWRMERKEYYNEEGKRRMQYCKWLRQMVGRYGTGCLERKCRYGSAGGRKERGRNQGMSVGYFANGDIYISGRSRGEKSRGMIREVIQVAVTRECGRENG